MLWVSCFSVIMRWSELMTVVKLHLAVEEFIREQCFIIGWNLPTYLMRAQRCWRGSGCNLCLEDVGCRSFCCCSKNIIVARKKALRGNEVREKARCVYVVVYFCLFFRTTSAINLHAIRIFMFSNALIALLFWAIMIYIALLQGKIKPASILQ